MLLDPGRVVDRYVVEAWIGEGGMAAVYRARHRELGTLHALKVLTNGGSDFRARFLREGRAQATLRHPNILPVTDLVDAGGSPALVMEYVPGPTLRELLERQRLDRDTAVGLFRQIVLGVAAAHESGVVHRDLKPANVLLVAGERGWVPKIADFGLLKSTRADASTTASGIGMGTPGYMAPEQARDASAVDVRADVFALGCIFYEMLFGERSFPGPGAIEALTASREGRYVRPAERAPDLPQPLVRLIEGCLAPDPADRFGACGPILALLRDEVPTLPEVAGPTLVPAPSPRRGTRWPILLPAFFAAVAFGGFATLGLLAWSSAGEPVSVESIAVVQADDPDPAPPAAAPGREPDVLVRVLGADPPEAAAAHPCGGQAGERIGWAHVQSPVFVFRPGSTWVLTRPRAVYASPPRDDGPIPSVAVCTLPERARVHLVEPAVRVKGRGFWVPVHAGYVE
jgi:hypothetical protein